MVKQSLTAQAITAELDAIGLRYHVSQSGGDHIRIEYGPNLEHVYFTAATTSDKRRGPLNARSDIRKQLREHGYLEDGEPQPQDQAVVTLHDGKSVCLSTDIAERFSKAHKNVLSVIDRVREECGPEFDGLNFQPISYRDKNNREKPAYAMTRDGFSLVVMGFTGKSATAWKVRYIEAFNAMEGQLVALTGESTDPQLRGDVDAALDLIASLEERVEALPVPRTVVPFIRPSVTRTERKKRRAERRARWA
jgi:Rha family phage regulatory protein